MNISEDLLYYLWKFRLFNLENLKTVDGEPVEIISTGHQNKDAGPDFEEAKIQIGGTLWAGSVEMHTKSSDWNNHQHTQNKAYNNVVLHVVSEYDTPVYRNNGTEIQTLELKNRIPNSILFNYKDLMQNMYWIPCENKMGGLDKIHINSWLSRLLIERLEEKSNQVLNLLEEYKGSWDDAFYITIAKNFGFKTNSLPFELLAKSLPQQILAKHKNNKLQTEALIFGQAGFLSESHDDEYYKTLQAEYSFLQKKHQLNPLEVYIWKFLRLRPNNFPTMRLAQFAALVSKSNHLFATVLELEDKKDLFALFQNLPISSYWEIHYLFGKVSGESSKQLGKQSINNILLNTVALFLFSYGKYIGNDNFVKRAIQLLENLPLETNYIINRFIEIGLKPGGADISQALLQLKKNYCDQKKCLSCGIGIKLLNKD